MRGKVGSMRRSASPCRITPAYAGKSVADIGSIRANKDHPRVCGEKNGTGTNQPLGIGSPPRMRGKAAQQYSGKPPIRITPAYAGKSDMRLFVHQSNQDHPRVCGEKTKKIHYNPIMLLNKTKFPLT